MSPIPLPAPCGQRHAARMLPVLALLSAADLAAATLHVSLDSPKPSPPFGSWATAATNVQDAVDAASTGDDILVTNGVYATGSREVAGVGFSRVAVTKAVRLLSVNGPEVTVIQGAKAPGGGNGDGAVRCVYLTGGASLTGFTLTNGATRDSGDRDRYGGGVWCAATSAMLTNCVLVKNSSGANGGGAFGGTLHNCTLANNEASEGGGALESTLYDCVLKDNWARGAGGGGARSATLYNCTLTGNAAWGDVGGGAWMGTLYNCTLTGNAARAGGGWAGDGTLYHCTLTGNSAWKVGGASGGKLYNCLVHFNEGGNWAEAGFEYSCTTPVPPGPGNVSSDPQLASITHLASTSPCLGAGSAVHAKGVDMDGEPWASPPAIGADQLWPGQSLGPVSMQIVTPFNGAVVGTPLTFTAYNSGPITQSVWDFDDGTVVTNQPFISHAWSVPGTYTVRLTGYNDSHPEGVTTSRVIEVSGEPVHYVDAANPTPAFPYTTWATAATTIQAAVNAAAVAGRLVLVTNGIYQTGQWEVQGTNRVALTNAVLRSVNGPDATIIDGAGEVRCVYLGANAILSGFTLRNGHARGQFFGQPEQNGGGVLAEPSAVVTNCVLTGNRATGYASQGGAAFGGRLVNCTLDGNQAVQGGGAYQSTLRNCVLAGNTASGGGGLGGGGMGGGAVDSTLYNCTVTGNYGMAAGGVVRSTLYNCIVHLNHGANQGWSSTFEYSCSAPLPPGAGNISADRGFAFDTHLALTSPCLGAGSPAYASGVDMDGEPWTNPPAMGADEVHRSPRLGPLTMQIGLLDSELAVGFPAPFTANLGSPIPDLVWDFGDGTLVTNQPAVRHAWMTPGEFEVQLTGYNDSHPEGVSTSRRIVVVEAVHYVNAANRTPAAPYTSWATAATNIQDAVNAGRVTGFLVLVTNGLYRSNAAETSGVNHVALTNAVLRSVNGPGVTILDGLGVVRCVRLGVNAILGGFTLQRGYALWSLEGASERWGGGVFGEASSVVTNCVLTGNRAEFGGGAAGGQLYDCVLTGNEADYIGGGAACDALYHCVLTGNRAANAAGASGGTLYHCILTGNSARNQGGGAFGGLLYGCTLISNSAGAFGGGAYDCGLYNCTLSGNAARSCGGGVYGGTLYNCIVYLNRDAQDGNWCPEDLGGPPTSFAYSCTTFLPPGPGNIDADPRFVNASAGDFRLRPDSPCIDAGTNLTDSLLTDILGLPRPLDGNRDGVVGFDMGAYEFNPYEFGPRLRLDPDGFHFTVLGEPGQTVRVERSADLLVWEEVALVPVPASGQTLVDPAAVSAGMLFYRAVSGP